MRDIIFIIGVGRSGTTLLQSMLHSHSEIHFSPETHFVKRFLNPEIHHKKYSWENRAKFERALLKDELFVDFILFFSLKLLQLNKKKRKETVK